MVAQIISIFEKQIQEFIKKRRPPVELRNKVDLGYTFENNVLEIFEVRPRWDEPATKTNSPIAKARYIKSKNIWKLYWMRASGNWDAYQPDPEIRELSKVLQIVDEDLHGCFWG